VDGVLVSGFVVSNIGFFPGLVGLIICALMCRIRWYQDRHAKATLWAAWSCLFGTLMVVSLVSPRF
jgi:hypothetical protein